MEDKHNKFTKDFIEAYKGFLSNSKKKEYYHETKIGIAVRTASYGRCGLLSGSSTSMLLEFDEEDLQYIINKYIKKDLIVSLKESEENLAKANSELLVALKIK